MLCFTPCIYNAYCKGRIVIADSALMTLYIAILSLTMMLMTCTCVNKDYYYYYYFLTICPSARPSVCPSDSPLWLCPLHRIIMKFSGVITNDQSEVHAKDESQRSKVKVTEVKTQLNCFRTVSPVWIHIWWSNYAYKRCPVIFQGQPSNFKIVDLDPNGRFRTVTPVWIHQWLRNDAQNLRWHGRGALLYFKIICQISRSHG